MERFDVVVAGARLAGCAIAAPLARAGKRVLVLDKMAFPSDQLSTHILLPTGTSEFSKMGALPRIRALNPSEVRYVEVVVDGVHCLERVRPAEDGIDYGVCVPRDLQDVELVEAAREQGADIRERCTVQGLTWRAGRVSGVKYKDADGVQQEVASTLVVGADGRRSTVSALVGSWKPYRVSRNGRGLVFRYYEGDPHVDRQAGETYYQWREGESFAFAFPTTPVGKVLALFMGHRDEASEARNDPEGYWQRKLGQHPLMAQRLEGATPVTKVRSTGETPAFFRASSGPGWVLAGDASHFKDPVTGQGMRDAMWMGRTIAEAILPVIDDPTAIDAATRAWEAERDRECLPAYHFANLDTRVEPQSPALRELVREAGRTTDADLSDLFGRARTLQQIAPLPRLTRALGAALIRGESPRSESLRRAFHEIRTELEIRREGRADVFRATRTVYGSDHPNAPWPDPPKVARPAEPALTETQKEVVA
ncbi:MAG: hypothetical protein QOG62_257 [Thermoleophilaceae bacterium]|nr:hypothetical protein [Thermoleophilaceae bacterium]